MASFAVEEEERENVGFIKDDYKNYLQSKRMIEMKMGDTGGVLEYLQRKQDEDPNFSYVIPVDIDDLVTNIFCSNTRIKIDYGHFGNVVCFDTTYKKNKEVRPFALFAGVNHHKQTTIFGAALLYDETTETFKWLFQSFAKAMPREEPMTILTDDDPAMAKALASSWPKTYHRLCVWHMYQNATKHLSYVFDEYKSFAKDFSRCLYDYNEVDDFINA
ncbi:hypothetical protein LIER_30653 [Lithospermum erythrorhizon]|uniref:MULE transposase domain-containing protein n=1 Tax=Lithospermum erythrorhizon TaxID=34254 RepID=A0AAV3RS29_LITER